MQYFSISFTHKNTSIEVRERLALSEVNKKNELLKLVLSHENIDECVVLSTCNRIEIMCYISDSFEVYEYIIKCLSLVCKIDEMLIKNLPDIYEDSGFLHHLFSVASSLDSLVIGETQIVGQLKDALNYSKNQDLDVYNLENAISFAFKCAANIRNETQISKNSISVSSVAVSKARECTDITNKKILLVGSGQMIELAAKHLLNHTKNINIISRTLENAKKLALNLGLNYLDFNDLKKHINEHDVIFCATSSNTAIITKNMIEPRNFKRYFFDIAVPRDIELSTCNEYEVYSVDDLNEIVKRNIEFKDEQAKIAYSIVSKMVKDFYKLQNSLMITPIIKAMRSDAAEIIDLEFNKALKKGYIKNSDKDEVYRFAKQLMQSFLHKPTIRLKEIEDNMEIESINYLFDVKG